MKTLYIPLYTAVGWATGKAFMPSNLVSLVLKSTKVLFWHKQRKITKNEPTNQCSAENGC